VAHPDRPGDLGNTKNEEPAEQNKLQTQKWSKRRDLCRLQGARQQPRQTEHCHETGTDSIGANGAVPPLTTCAAKITRFPVICAVNKLPSARKLITSRVPAVRLSTQGSSFMASELSTDGINTLRGPVASVEINISADASPPLNEVTAPVS
jgi:hypothetical protein